VWRCVWRWGASLLARSLLQSMMWWSVWWGVWRGRWQARRRCIGGNGIPEGFLLLDVLLPLRIEVSRVIHVVLKSLHLGRTTLRWLSASHTKGLVANLSLDALVETSLRTGDRKLLLRSLLVSSKSPLGLVDDRVLARARAKRIRMLKSAHIP